MQPKSTTHPSDPREPVPGEDEPLAGELPWPLSPSMMRAFEPVICGRRKSDGPNHGYLPCSEWSGHERDGRGHVYEAVRMPPVAVRDEDTSESIVVIVAVLGGHCLFWIGALWAGLAWAAGGHS